MTGSAIILAGGRSARMGTSKTGLRFGDETMIARMAGELRRAFEDIVVVAAPREVESEPIEAALGAYATVVTLIRDGNAYEGPAGALVRGLEAARNEIAFACSCDLPLIRVEVAQMLCGLAEAYEAAVPEIGGRLQPLCAAYQRKSALRIAEMVAEGEQRMTTIASRLELRRVSEVEIRKVDETLRSFVNVNTHMDYLRAVEESKSAARRR